MSSIVKKIFGGGEKPKKAKPAEVIPDPPSVDTEAVQVAGDTQRRRARKAKGRGATQLTGGSGITTSANTGTKKLLGS